MKLKFHCITKVEINGKKWEIGYGHPGTTKGKTDDGICRYDECRIIINRRASCSLLDVLAHEIIHARVPDLSEESVGSTATLIAQAYDEFSKQPSRDGK
jgi:hypothetical protein